MKQKTLLHKLKEDGWDLQFDAREKELINSCNEIIEKSLAIQQEPRVKPDACGQWQKTKPDKPCYFVHRHSKRDNKPDLYDANFDGEELCVFNIQDEAFVCTMGEFVDDGEFHVIEYHSKHSV